MTSIGDQHISGVKVERMSLRGAWVTGVEVRSGLFGRSRMRDVQLVDLDISGDLRNVVVNGVDIAPLVEAELDRRMPERAKMRPEDSDGFREAWAILERLWDATVARARTFPEEALHRSVDDEWSFVQTLRHLNFASACWVDRMILGEVSPWLPLDLPSDDMSPWDGFGWDRDARPSLDDVLALRDERRATVRGVLGSLTDATLAVRSTRTEPGWPQETDFPVQECLRIVLDEEWEHRLYAERDLTALEQ
ncbi:MAG: DinB family protein [Pseudonocardia sp.]|nr:DinB family protein [Pseudonocardia sp.]